MAGIVRQLWLLTFEHRVVKSETLPVRETLREIAEKISSASLTASASHTCSQSPNFTEPDRRAFDHLGLG